MSKRKKVKAGCIRPEKIEAVRGERCVCCGKPLAEGGQAFVAQVQTRCFHTCSTACKEATERYVQADKRQKIWLYLILLLSAIGILISAVDQTKGAMHLLTYVSIFLAGFGFLVFPYPITSFETFLSCPIRRVTAISRGIGILFCALAVLFFILTR